MELACATCGKPFTAKRRTAKYCSEKCKKRPQRAPKLVALAHLTAADLRPDPPEPPERGRSAGVADATERELADAGRLDTALGQAALSLAQRVDSSALDTGSSFASLIREHRATLAAALEGAKKSESKLEELRRRRAERRVAGA